MIYEDFPKVMQTYSSIYEDFRRKPKSSLKDAKICRLYADIFKCSKRHAWYNETNTVVADLTCRYIIVMLTLSSRQIPGC